MVSNRKPFSEQIKLLIDEYGIGNLANIANVSDTMLRNWRKGLSEPGLKNLLVLSEVTGRSVQWLATGFDNDSVSKVVIATEMDMSDFALVNLYDAQVSMGSGAWNEDEHVINQLAYRKDWLSSEGLDPEHCAAIIARGDSMEETIKDGATLLIDLKDNTISRDGVYVIRFDGHLLAKRIQRSYDGGLVIRSDNKAYVDISVPKENTGDIQIIGRVVWNASTL